MRAASMDLSFCAATSSMFTQRPGEAAEAAVRIQEHLHRLVVLESRPDLAHAWD